MTLALSGQGVMNGVAIGQAHHLVRSELSIREYHLADDKVEAEITRLADARSAARRQLQQLENQLGQHAGTSAVEILQTHQHMLDDPMLTGACEQLIRNDKINAEWALQQQEETILAEFDALGDDYIRARSEDIRQVVTLIQQQLDTGSLAPDADTRNGVADDLSEHTIRNTIIIADDLAPSEVVQLNDRQVAGLVTRRGSRHSHSAILARSLRIPSLTGVEGARLWVEEGEQLILDGYYGCLFLAADESINRHYQSKQRDGERYRANLESLRNQPTASRDGLKIQLLANAEQTADITEARSLGMDGVGLFRTEYLFLGETAPDENMQFEAYSGALEAIANRPVTIRTLDLGADKPDVSGEFISRNQPPPAAAANPALGLRGLRLCLRKPELFKRQLRAILRASSQGPIRLMVPMISTTQELHQLHGLLEECRRELSSEGHDFDRNMPIGAMIEVPATALNIDDFLPLLDFVSVGTNDLIQYLLATDRVDEQVSYLYDPVHPAVIQLLRHVFDRCRKAQVPVSVCGEMASDPRYIRLLLALGLREFSLHPGSMLEVKQIVCETDIGASKAALTRAMERFDGNAQQLLRTLDTTQRH